MKSFVIFAIVVTIIYVIYYTVIIVQDLYGKPKDEKSQGESFDVSDMTDEEESNSGQRERRWFQRRRQPNMRQPTRRSSLQSLQRRQPPLRKRASLMCLKRYKAQSRRRWRK